MVSNCVRVKTENDEYKRKGKKASGKKSDEARRGSAEFDGPRWKKTQDRRSGARLSGAPQSDSPTCRCLFGKFSEISEYVLICDNGLYSFDLIYEINENANDVGGTMTIVQSTFVHDESIDVVRMQLTVEYELRCQFHRGSQSSNIDCIAPIAFVLAGSS